MKKHKRTFRYQAEINANKRNNFVNKKRAPNTIATPNIATSNPNKPKIKYFILSFS